MIVTVLGIKQIWTKDDTFWIHNYSLNGRDEDYVIAQSWFFFFYISTWTGSACVQDLIGLILYKYTNQGLQPPLKVQNVSYDVALFKLSW